VAGHDNWGTPPEFFNICNEEFNYELDAAASKENTLCPRYIDEQMNALVTPWDAKSVWCNPPYSMLPAFIKRGYEQHVEHKNLVTVLVPAYTDPKYWSDYVMKAHEIRFLKGRLQYLENGKKKQSARFPSVLIVFKWISGEHYGKAPQQWVWDWRK
jgi:phage N-6-adenine-methyltransferase